MFIVSDFQGRMAGHGAFVAIANTKQAIWTQYSGQILTHSRARTIEWWGERWIWLNIPQNAINVGSEKKCWLMSSSQWIDSSLFKRYSGLNCMRTDFYFCLLLFRLSDTYGKNPDHGRWICVGGDEIEPARNGQLQDWTLLLLRGHFTTLHELWRWKIIILVWE